MGSPQRFELLPGDPTGRLASLSLGISSSVRRAGAYLVETLRILEHRGVAAVRTSARIERTTASTRPSCAAS